MSFDGLVLVTFDDAEFKGGLGSASKYINDLFKQLTDFLTDIGLAIEDKAFTEFRYFCTEGKTVLIKVRHQSSDACWFRAYVDKPALLSSRIEGVRWLQVKLRTTIDVHTCCYECATKTIKNHLVQAILPNSKLTSVEIESISD